VHRDEWDDVTRLRRATQSYDIPFVVVTSWLWADGRSRQRARELQCTAVLAKPCPIESVLHVLLRAMDADTR
jgi:CheY-like chemotaxis protein